MRALLSGVRSRAAGRSGCRFRASNSLSYGYSASAGARRRRTRSLARLFPSNAPEAMPEAPDPRVSPTTRAELVQIAREDPDALQALVSEVLRRQRGKMKPHRPRKRPRRTTTRRRRGRGWRRAARCRKALQGVVPRSSRLPPNL